MKISFITDEATQSFCDAVALAKKYSLDGIELRSVENLPIDSISRPMLYRWKRMLDDNSLLVPCLSSSFYKCDMADINQHKYEIEKLVRLCDAADILECKLIRGFTFFRNTQHDVTLDELLPYFVEDVADILQKRGKQLLLEADPSVNTTNHMSLANFLSRLNNNNFAAIYDPGNDLYDPLHEKPFPDGYNAIKKYTSHIHIKDAVFGELNEITCVKPGSGLVGYPLLLSRLVDDGYAGWLSLETHYRKSIVLSEEQMRLPQGTAFSEGGMEAMEESILALQEMLCAIKENTK